MPTTHIDYLSVTYPQSLPQSKLLPVPTRWKPDGVGQHGYIRKYISPFGAIWLSGGTQAQGEHVVLAGQALESLRHSGITDDRLIRHVLLYHGKVTRLDGAIDDHGSTLTVEDVERLYMVGQLSVPVRAVVTVKAIGGTGHTLYFGAPTSDRRVRVYDKAAEQNLTDPWVRYEVQLRRMPARHAVSRISNANAQAVIRSILREFLRTEDRTLRAILNGPEVPYLPLERPISNTYRWLMETCAPALAHYEADHPDEGAYQAFVTVYESELSKCLNNS